MLTKDVIGWVVFVSVLFTVLVWVGMVYSGEVLPTQVSDDVFLGGSGVQLGIINQLPEGAEWVDQDNIKLENGSIVSVEDVFPEYFGEVGNETED